MSEMKLPFIPGWLDDAGMRPVVFRLYCHLRRCADNDSFTAWPSYDTMTKVCGAGKSTIRRALKELEERGLVTKAGKPFGGSCRYRLLAPIVPPQGQMGGGNSSTTGTIESLPIVPPQDCNSPSSGTPVVQPQGQEGKPKKVNQKKVNQESEVTPEANQFARWFKESLPSNINLQATWHRKFAETYGQLTRIDKLTDQEIREVCQWARSDSFWSGNFYSPAKLRQRNKDGITYFDLFRQRMKAQPKSISSVPHKTINTGPRTPNSEDV